MTDEETGLYEEDMYNDNGDGYLWQEEERLNNLNKNPKGEKNDR